MNERLPQTTDTKINFDMPPVVKYLHKLFFWLFMWVYYILSI